VGELTSLLGHSSLPLDYEAGQVDSSEFLEGVSRLCGFPFEGESFIRAFTDIFTPIESTLELIRRLAPRYRLGLISNPNPWHFEHAIRTCEVFPLFGSVTLSHEVKALKPDSRLFQDSLRKLDLPAEACIFIDDRLDFAKGASRFGMHGITYTDHPSLIRELEALGVSV